MESSSLGFEAGRAEFESQLCISQLHDLVKVLNTSVTQLIKWTCEGWRVPGTQEIFRKC